MKKYLVQGEFSGYCRGIVQFEVEAENEAEAIKNWYEGKEIFREVVRDDSDIEMYFAKELVNEQTKE